MDFDSRYHAYKSYIEQYLSEQCFAYSDQPQQRLFEAMRYSLLAGGKRLRPVLVLDFCRMCGGDWKSAAPFAAAVEMIHTYSLIHDDLPCMDNDDYRRGRLTNHKVYGEAMAVLAGDGLLTAAFTTIAKSNFSAEIKIRAIEILSQCSGELGMVGGQALDMMSDERQCTQDEVLAIQTRKTGALIRAACMLGVLAGCGTQKQISMASEFASHLGLAFQIRDDVLDVIGNQDTLGKAVGVDTIKNTFVQLYGLEQCNQMIFDETNKALDALSEFKNTEFTVSLSKKLIERIQ